MIYKRKAVIQNIPFNNSFTWPYPYIEITTHEDAENNQRVACVGILDEGDSAVDGTHFIDWSNGDVPL